MTEPATILAGDPPGGDKVRTSLVEVVVPVYNEEHTVERCVRRLHAYLEETFPYPYRITVADNASTDRTWQVATALAAEIPQVNAVHLDLKGRGRALRKVWGDSDADVVAYMLSVSGLPPGRDELPTDRAALAAVVTVPQAE